MAPTKQRLLGRLRRAVEKVRVLLSIDNSRWIISSFLTRTKSTRPRPLSFKNPPAAGLLDCIDHDDDFFHSVGSSFVLSRSTSMATDRSRSTTPPVSDITRSSSGVSSSADDIDRRADDFIANFYKHIQMERQVSLQLRYLQRPKDDGGTTPPPLQRTRSHVP